jgi:hypothetical protein
MGIKAIMLSCALLAATCAPAFGVVIAPDQPVNGFFQSELTARWWQWHVSYPTAINPVLDTTGANAHLGSDQGPVAHPGVFFLAGNFSGNESRRVTVGNDQSLFLPFINIVAFMHLFGNTEAEIRADAAATLGTVSGLYAKLDGVDVALPASAPSPSDYRQQSALFALTIPATSMYADFGVPPGVYDSVTDGYWLALGPLSVGQHTLEFGAAATGTPPDYPEFSPVQTYTITVTTAVPEPGTWATLGAGLAVVAMLVRRRNPA